MKTFVRFPLLPSWALVAVLAALGCEAEPAVGSVSGVVTTDDAANPGARLPVSGVTIKLADLDAAPEDDAATGRTGAFIAVAQTGKDGRYAFDDLPPGRYDVLALPAEGFPWFDRAQTSDAGPLVVEEGRGSAFQVDFVPQPPDNAQQGKCRCSVGCGFSTIFYFICWPICCASCYTAGTYEHLLCFNFDPDY